MAMRLLAVIGFVCLYGIPAFANGGGQGCTQLRHVHGYTAVLSFLGQPLIADSIYQGEDAERITRAYNATPPESSVVADTIVVFEIRGAPKVMMFFALGDCLTNVGVAPVESWDKLVNGGDPS